MTRAYLLCSEAIILFRLPIYIYIMYVEIVRFRLYSYYIILYYIHTTCVHILRICLYKRIRLFPSVLFVLPPFSVHYSCVVRDPRRHRGTGADTWNYQKPREPPRSWAVTDGRTDDEFVRWRLRLERVFGLPARWKQTNNYYLNNSALTAYVQMACARTHRRKRPPFGGDIV